MIDRGSECARHQEALAALAERRDPTLAGQAALQHVEACRTCSEALGELILTVFALRRLGSEAAVATAATAQPDDAWTRLRVRIDRSRRLAREQAWRWRATLGGLATASLLVAAVVGPATVTSGTNLAGDEVNGGSRLALDRLEQELELATLRSERRTFNPMGDLDGEPSAAVAGGTTYPDVIRPVRKEVLPAERDVGIPKPGRVVPAI